MFGRKPLNISCQILGKTILNGNRLAQITVYKLNENGEAIWSYQGTVLKRDKSKIRLEAFFNRDDLDLGFTTFNRGDRFVETFYSQRWYNIFAVYDKGDGKLKGWYCNICRPAEFTDSAVRCEDLALDLWVSPDGQTLLLDEDEFNDLSLESWERQNCLQGLQDLQDMARLGSLPR